MKRADAGSPPIGSTDLHLSTHLFHPPRLTIAREMRGLTKAELAQRIGKSAAAVSQFEAAGRVSCRPDASTLGTIALVLGVPVNFFAPRYPAARLDLEQCHFRSLRSTSQRDRRKLLAVGTLTCDLLRFLEEHLELPTEGVSQVARTVASAEEIERAALDLRRGWGLGLGPIPNVTRLLESHGVVVVHIPAGCSEVDAFSTWSDGRPLVFLVMEKGSTSRTRFDASHELGHLVMHTDACPGNAELERQANRFASAFLLPAETFASECPRWLNWDQLYELKARWRVSVQALVRRAFDLQLLSKASYRRAFVHMNKTGERQNERGEPSPEPPTLIAKSLEELAPDFTMEDVGRHLGLGSQQIARLLQDGSW
ncbi:MAG: XRE family transcriptional regulator [Polyangiaceae bacterium]